jgi:hypothetical protein
LRSPRRRWAALAVLPAALAAAVVARAETIVPAGGGARDSLQRVYQSPAFRDLDRTPDRGPFAALGDAFLRLLRAVLDTLGAPVSLLLGALVLAAAIIAAVLRLRGVLGGRQLHIAEEPAAAGDDPDREWDAAETAAAAGDYREAVRRAFRSALLSIGLRGRLPLQASWTTRDLLRHAAGDADLLAALAPAAEAFDRAWYGGMPVGAADWSVARGRCQAVRQLARRRVAT